MASDDSNALRRAYVSMSERMAANPNMDMRALREMVDGLQMQAAEPTEVTYEEVRAGGRAAIWCKPLGAADDRVILYTHGGGYIANTKETVRKLAGHLAKAANCLALVPDYRLAPEFTFPAQLDDAVGSYHWLLDQGFKSNRIAIAGESAGGNLATATVLKLRNDGAPLPGAIVGFSPWFDLEGKEETFMTNAATDAFLSKSVSQMMAKIFLGSTGRAEDPLANPRFADPKGLPPIFLTAGSQENLLASIQGFAKTASRSGVEVTVEISEGMQHAYEYMAGRAPEADQTISHVGSWLRSVLEG